MTYVDTDRIFVTANGTPMNQGKISMRKKKQPRKPSLQKDLRDNTIYGNAKSTNSTLSVYAKDIKNLKIRFEEPETVFANYLLPIQALKILKKYLSVKANANMKAVRNYRRGDGYDITAPITI